MYSMDWLHKRHLEARQYLRFSPAEHMQVRRHLRFNTWPVLIADACHFPATFTLPSSPTMTHIFVEDCWGMRLEFHATLSDPVHTLKQMIEETDGRLIGVCMLFMWRPFVELFVRLPAQQRLEYRGSVLQDDDSLESYQISDESIIQLSSTFGLLFVMTLTGITLPFPIDLDAPLSQLQEMVYDKIDLPLGRRSPSANDIIVNDILL